MLERNAIKPGSPEWKMLERNSVKDAVARIIQYDFDGKVTPEMRRELTRDVMTQKKRIRAYNSSRGIKAPSSTESTAGTAASQAKKVTKKTPKKTPTTFTKPGELDDAVKQANKTRAKVDRGVKGKFVKRTPYTPPKGFSFKPGKQVATNLFEKGDELGKAKTALDRTRRVADRDPTTGRAIPRQDPKPPKPFKGPGKKGVKKLRLGRGPDLPASPVTPKTPGQAASAATKSYKPSTFKQAIKKSKGLGEAGRAPFLKRIGAYAKYGSSSASRAGVRGGKVALRTGGKFLPGIGWALTATDVYEIGRNAVGAEQTEQEFKKLFTDQQRVQQVADAMGGIYDEEFEAEKADALLNQAMTLDSTLRESVSIGMAKDQAVHRASIAARLSKYSDYMEKPSITASDLMRYGV
jgi:hypothetical protein